MFNYTSFHDVFPTEVQLPYDRRLQHDIEAHRKNADDVLFIDRVMRALGISKAKVYPPKTENALRQLHQQICEAGMSMHHKFSLLYYILLDFDDASKEVFVSESFASLSGMPANYQLFMKGLWHMDREEYSRAIEYVAHPSLNPDFADDIIIALIKQASDQDYTLALSYFYSVQPILKSPVALELLYDAMARTNVTQALLYSRTHPQHTREQLFRRWISCVLNNGSGDDLPSRTSELAFMPFDLLEETWFEEYLTTGEGRTLKRAKDTLLIRKIACDRFSDVAKVRPSGQWAGILEGIKGGTEGQGD
ncbi:Protein ELYS [Metarhizium anisopliae]|nr:Protein ELYS [Metarhizium anisopliae]